MFLLTLKEKHKLTQVSINYALGHVKQMTSRVVDDVHCKVRQHLLNTTNIQIPDLSSCFTDINPFEGLETEHMQSKFYKDHFNLIVRNVKFLTVILTCIFQEPISVELGTHLDSIRNGCKRRFAEVKDVFQYVPFLQGLQSLLSHPDIRDEVSNVCCMHFVYFRKIINATGIKHGKPYNPHNVNHSLWWGTLYLPVHCRGGLSSLLIPRQVCFNQPSRPLESGPESHSF